MKKQSHFLVVILFDDRIGSVSQMKVIYHFSRSFVDHPPGERNFLLW